LFVCLLEDLLTPWACLIQMVTIQDRRHTSSIEVLFELTKKDLFLQLLLYVVLTGDGSRGREFGPFTVTERYNTGVNLEVDD
jgi:hypothetical protein